MKNQENSNLESEELYNFIQNFLKKKPYLEELYNGHVIHSFKDFNQLYLALADQQIDKSPDGLKEVDDFHYKTFMAIATTFDSCILLLEKGRLYNVLMLIHSLDELIVKHIFATMKLRDNVKFSASHNLRKQINAWYDSNNTQSDLEEVIKVNQELFEVFEIIGKKEKQSVLDFKDRNIENKIFYYSSLNMTGEITFKLSNFLYDLEYNLALKMIQHLAFLISLDENITNDPDNKNIVLPELEKFLHETCRLYTPYIYEYLAQKLDIEPRERINIDDI